jgi:hypothetical protein
MQSLARSPVEGRAGWATSPRGVGGAIAVGRRSGDGVGRSLDFHRPALDGAGGVFLLRHVCRA